MALLYLGFKTTYFCSYLDLTTTIKRIVSKTVEHVEPLYRGVSNRASS